MRVFVHEYASLECDGKRILSEHTDNDYVS